MKSAIACWQAQRRIGRALRQSGVDGKLYLTGERAEHGGRTVFEGVLADRAISVVVHSGPRAAVRAEAEAGELSHKRTHLSDKTFRVPEMIAAAPEAGIVLTEGVPGRRLDRMINDEPDGRHRALGRAGSWLAVYAGAERASDDFGGGFWIRRHEDTLNRTPEGPLRDRMQALLAGMRSERGRISNRPITRARSHGALRAGLLYADGETTWGTGPVGDHWIALVKDVAHFMVDLETVSAASDGSTFCGFPESDLDAFLGREAIVTHGEVNAMLPYFAASEMFRKLEKSKSPNAGGQQAALGLADRMIADQGWTI